MRLTQDIRIVTDLREEYHARASGGTKPDISEFDQMYAERLKPVVANSEVL